MKLAFAFLALLGLAEAGSSTLCLHTNNAWLPSECCIASSATGFRCSTTSQVLLAWSDCNGGPPDIPNMGGCMAYQYEKDRAMSTVYKGKGVVWWYTEATAIPPCPMHGNITTTFSVTAG